MPNVIPMQSCGRDDGKKSNEDVECFLGRVFVAIIEWFFWTSWVIVVGLISVVVDVA